MKVGWGSINWTEKDKYIIENYKNMTYKTMAANLGLNNSTLCSRILKLRDEGKVGRKKKPPKKEENNQK